MRPQAAREEEAAGRRSMKGRDAFEELKRMAAATVSATPPGLRGGAPGGGGEASTSGSGAAPAQPRARALLPAVVSAGSSVWDKRMGCIVGHDMGKQAGQATGGAAKRGLLGVTERSCATQG